MGLMGYRVLCILWLQMAALRNISCHPEKMPQIKNISARDGLYMFPWHLGKRSDGVSPHSLGKRSEGLKGPKLSPHSLGKRSPSADPGGVSLSVTANMDTLRNRLLWSLQNNHKQFGRADLHSAG
eukprot:TRINITY_DN16295_c0_g1_i2.p1 TRINITY_DN16295_c0_g1~~TRINITY_DN16295_c0_g1_i2.p1  ORF type:complete len:141 (-),score=24.44 TRINITY_DN16295_c0_g1_i2:67-441(-)